MSTTYGKKKRHQSYVLYSVVVTLLLSVVFFTMVKYLYNKAEDEAYEALHAQTKQVRDDIVLQLTSDRENLATMANFAAKLYRDGEDYSLLFESFKPIGMIESIGILNKNNTYTTKSGTSYVSGYLSFEEEKAKGIYISGKIADVKNENYELVRSAVPIKVRGETVGILYGIIKLDKLGKRYSDIVNQLNAQLFIYEKDSGEIIVNTVLDELGNISFLKDRVYTKGNSYEKFVSTDSGNTSFESAYRNETLHLHYSTIEEFDWMIAMGRYDSEVLKGAHSRVTVFTAVYFIMIGIILVYILILMTMERKVRFISECAANVRKELLETNDGHDNIQDALIEICNVAKATSAVFFDTSGEFYHYLAGGYDKIIKSEQARINFCTELFRYAAEFHTKTNDTVNVFCIKADKHMLRTNRAFYDFLNEHGINEISFVATINKSNHTTILATINSGCGDKSRSLAEKVSACFSMALYNKNHLNNTLLTATTDALTGVLNRVSYKNDLKIFADNDVNDFSCVYIDVNELHICNNKYGHAAGDQMLVYIANTLKEVFLGHRIYRMGGDEFLVFCQNTSQEEVKANIEFLHKQIRARNYHVAVGMAYRTKNTNTEEMVNEAEVKMYEEKAQYYQNKEYGSKNQTTEKEYVQTKTGILEIDTMLSVLKEKYNGIYRVTLDTDKARRILMPAYLNYNEEEEQFSRLFSKYVEESVNPDYHRALLSFMNYEALKRQLSDGTIPHIRFKKNDGEYVVLSVYKLDNATQSSSDTLWVFAKD